MFAAFNLILIALVALIAYWWINQGLFSAVLHFVCVVVAGALAFAVWEPLAVKMLDADFASDYAWGIALLGPFSLFLFLARLACDKLVPNNLNFPQWAHYSVGGVFGAASGVLTIGMLLIGGGFIKSAKDEFLAKSQKPIKPDGMSDKDFALLPANYFGPSFAETELGSYDYVKVLQYDPAASKGLEIINQWLQKSLGGTDIATALSSAQSDMESQIGNPFAS